VEETVINIKSTMKTRLRIFLLTIKIGLIAVFLGFIGELWWVISGRKNFTDKMVEAISREIRSLEDSQNILCAECGEYFTKKGVIIKGDIDICDECLCPE